MNTKNNNYRVMKFLEPVNKKDNCRGYVRLDVRGNKGMIIVSVENVGDSKSSSDVFLYKNNKDKIKIGTVNNKKGMVKKAIVFNDNISNIEDYNVCGIVKDSRIVLYSSLYNSVNVNDIKKLEETVRAKSIDDEQEDLKEDENIEVIKTESLEEEKLDEEKDETMLSENDYVDEGVDDKVYEILPEDEAEKADSVDKAEDIEESKDEVESTARKNRGRDKFQDNLYNILNEYNTIEPLSVTIQNLTWWKVPYDDRGVKDGVLPYYNQVISSYYPFPMSNRVTTCHGLIRKYGHYLFGIYKENDKIKHFVYGVPGEFKRDEQPYKGITGFKNWSYKNKNIDGSFGYWIAFVNSFTGEVTEPPHIVPGK